MRLKSLELKHILRPLEYMMPSSQCPCTVTLMELYRIGNLHLLGFRICFYSVTARGITYTVLRASNSGGGGIFRNGLDRP